MTRVRKASRRELLSRGGALAALGIAGVLAPRRALAGGLGAHFVENRHHGLRPRSRDGVDALSPPEPAWETRPPDADLGALSRGLARGRGPCQRHRRAEIIM